MAKLSREAQGKVIEQLIDKLMAAHDAALNADNQASAVTALSKIADLLALRLKADESGGEPTTIVVREMSDRPALVAEIGRLIAEKEAANGRKLHDDEIAAQALEIVNRCVKQAPAADAPAWAPAAPQAPVDDPADVELAQRILASLGVSDDA